MRKELEAIALDVLKNSLIPLPHEKNELDWKSDLSQKSDKIAQHLSAFANLQAGGFLVFGISDQGVPQGVRGTSYTEIIKKLGNIARESVTPSITIDHSIVPYDGVELLLVYIPESQEKPVHLRGGTIYDSYLRSAGQTRKMTRQEVARVIARSSGSSIEGDNASGEITADEVVKRLDIQAFFDLLSKPFPQDINAIISSLETDDLIKRTGISFVITNLGALLFAKDLRQFEHLKRESVRVIIYEQTDRLRTLKEQEFFRGYASGFESLVQYVNDQTPRNEVIEKALRREVKMYPALSIRELIANAVIHQDLNEIVSVHGL